MWAEATSTDLLPEATARAEALGRPVLLSVTRRVAAHDPLAAFAAASDERALWLRPSTGESLVGLGAAHVLTCDGLDRFAHASHAWQALVQDALISDPDPRPWTGPVLLGGFAFDPLHPRGPTWAAFPDTRLVVPTRILAQRDGQAWQTDNLVVGGAQQCSVTRTLLSREALERGVQGGAAPSAKRPKEGCQRRSSTWQSLVGSVAAGIGDGSLGVEKVVLARQTQVHTDTPPDLALRRLATDYPTCTVFAVSQRGSTFLGATPERLVQADRGTVSTMALAGSTRRGQAPAEDEALGQQLLSSAKERQEHAVVVRALREALSAADLCTSLVADAEPRLARLPNVQHLLTPIRAQLAPGKSLLDLVGRLHPSPAVGGFPQARALAIIREREGLDRGWYGGPLGWVNAAGDGEFVVAIRSGLLRGSDAWLYAGCGIVAGSEPSAEFAESDWKLSPMRAALGVSA